MANNTINKNNAHLLIISKRSLSHKFMHLLLPLVIALIYGGLLMALPIDVFRDRGNYLRYAEKSFFLLEYYWKTGVLTCLANEPLWLLLNAGLAEIFPPEIVVRLIIFFPASLIAWHMLRQKPHQFLWILCFLLLPQTIVHHICQLRQGVAIAVFLIGYFSQRQSIRIVAIAATPFIHSSFFIVVLLLALVGFGKRVRLDTTLRIIAQVGVSLGIGLAVGFIGLVLGARQVESSDLVLANISGVGFFFWGMVLVVICMEGRAFLYRYAFEVSTLILYLATYFLTKFTARIFENTLLLLLLAGLYLTGLRRYIFLSMIVVLGAGQYFLLFDVPWLGWGKRM